jgi:AAA domain
MPKKQCGANKSLLPKASEVDLICNWRTELFDSLENSDQKKCFLIMGSSRTGKTHAIKSYQESASGKIYMVAPASGTVDDFIEDLCNESKINTQDMRTRREKWKAVSWHFNKRVFYIDNANNFKNDIYPYLKEMVDSYNSRVHLIADSSIVKVLDNVAMSNFFTRFVVPDLIEFSEVMEIFEDFVDTLPFKISPERNKEWREWIRRELHPNYRIRLPEIAALFDVGWIESQQEPENQI